VPFETADCQWAAASGCRHAINLNLKIDDVRIQQSLVPKATPYGLSDAVEVSPLPASYHAAMQQFLWLKLAQPDSPDDG
jgi:hypothetical protein